MSEPTDQRPLEVLTIGWADLKPHAVRQRLFMVGLGADLMTVARAVAADDKERVEGWIRGGAIVRPSVAQMEEWDAEPSHSFDFVIVQPFVLAVGPKDGS